MLLIKIEGETERPLIYNISLKGVFMSGWEILAVVAVIYYLTNN